MGISIITPHYNSLSGLKSISSDLKAQTSDQWEWIIVDDCSDEKTKEEIKSFFKDKDSRIQMIFNTQKTNASHCRNIGADRSQYDTLVFLDADDFIFPDFVANRNVDINDFKVYLNFQIINSKGHSQPFSNITSDFLDNFLKARFAWQTTAVLWNKDFFNQIGKFDENMTNLQDVEIAIKALINGKNYQVSTDNPVDFQYFVTPINVQKRSVFKISESVVYLANKLVAINQLSDKQVGFLTSYYFVCIRYLVRGKLKREGIPVVKNVANSFKALKIFNTLEYYQALLLLTMYRYGGISEAFFIKINRHLFKK